MTFNTMQVGVWGLGDRQGGLKGSKGWELLLLCLITQRNKDNQMKRKITKRDKTARHVTVLR